MILDVPLHKIIKVLLSSVSYSLWLRMHVQPQMNEPSLLLSVSRFVFALKKLTPLHILIWQPLCCI